MLFHASYQSLFATLSLISFHALLVNVTISMFEGAMPFSFIIYSTLAVSVAVFQLQAQAIIKSGQFIWSLASFCFGFKSILF
jgi:hypothetical protein